jgi:hypothetical protein
VLRGREDPPPAWIRLRPWRPAQSPEAGAALLGVPPGEIVEDPRMGLRAAAALLGDLSRRMAISPTMPLAAWRAVLSPWNASGDPDADRLYAEHVMALLASGFSAHVDAEAPVVVPPAGEPIDVVAPAVNRPAGIDGAAFATFLPAAPSTHRTRESRAIRYIVIHTMENDFATVVEFFRRRGTAVGAHYVVRGTDGLVVQMVDERAVVFHDACFNELSIGIEHEGYAAAGDVWFSDALYAASARLVRDIARRYGVPLDRAHVLGHGDAPDCSEHTDPGALWDWERFMRELRGAEWPREPVPAR